MWRVYISQRQMCLLVDALEGEHEANSYFSLNSCKTVSTDGHIGNASKECLWPQKIK